MHLPHGFTPLTHVQLKIPMVDVSDTLCLDVMQIFISIRNVTKVTVHDNNGFFFP